jgi:hypothetical protein
VERKPREPSSVCDAAARAVSASNTAEQPEPPRATHTPEPDSSSSAERERVRPANAGLSRLARRPQVVDSGEVDDGEAVAGLGLA